MVMHSEIITSEVTYVLDQRIKDAGPMKGAFRNGSSLVVPYFASLAATALALSGEPNTLQPVTDYVRWYLNSLNWPDILGLHGTVYDYEHDCAGWRQKLNRRHKDFPEDPTKRVPHCYDSADAYAATFISLLRAYVHAGGDTALLVEFDHQIEIIAGMMVTLMKDDHLTIAKPNNPTKYLMDNCQVYRGLEDAAWLFEHVFHDTAKAGYFQSWATKNRAGILSHLVDGDQQFYASKSGSGKLDPVDWEKWYPDAVSQLFPVVYGVIPASDERAVYVYGELTAKHPTWNTFDADHPHPDDFPWAMVAYAAARMGKTNDLERYKTAAWNHYIKVAPRNAWLWHPAEAGWLIRACRYASCGPEGW